MEPIKMQEERRSKARFTIKRDVRYRMADRGVVASAGCGQTIDIGSGGVAFMTDRPLTQGLLVELSISWPVLLEESCPMRFVVYGRILRCAGRRAVCSIDKYEFRTQARGFQTVVPTRTDAVLQRWADEMHRGSMKIHVAGA